MKTLARAADREGLIRRLRTLRPDSRRRFGRMSVHQMVCHLADVMQMSHSERVVSRGWWAPLLPLFRWLVLYLPIPWLPGIQTVPELDQERGGTQPTEFAADVERVAALIAREAAKPVTRPRHPVLGHMTEPEWLRWGWLHTDHHLRQFGV